MITGASSGIGKALAIDLISSGWNVCILARSENKLKEIANEYNSNDIDIKVIKCDVQESAQILSACKQIKEWSGDTLNLLVNNVGGGSGMGNSLENITIKDWDFDINLNLRSAFIFTQQLLSSLKNTSKTPLKYNGIYTMHQSLIYQVVIHKIRLIRHQLVILWLKQV